VTSGVRGFVGAGHSRSVSTAVVTCSRVR
jgi:hypothetical protein